MMANYDTDYDLAILGGSISSRLAACRAAQKGARVALIAPNWYVSDAVEYSLKAIHQSVLDLNEDWGRLFDWHRYQRAHAVLSPTGLSSQGIDVILEPARFIQNQCLKLEHRYLKASRYLLSDGYELSIPISPWEDGLLCHQLVELPTIAQRVAVIGDGATAAEWAYALSRVATVTLVTSGQGLLPAEDDDIQRLSEAQFKSLGIQVVCLKRCSQVGEDFRQTAQVDAEQVVVVPQPYNWDALGLEHFGIGTPMAVNCHLQTNHSDIYAVGGSLGGENRSELTQQETNIALGNALFGRWRIMRYEAAFYSIDLLSPIGRWGLTEGQARQRYGDSVEIFQASCLPARAEHIAQTNFCKLVVVGARILGVHLMGDGAPALVAALGHTANMQTLGQWSRGYFQAGTLQAAIYQAMEQWQSRRWRGGQWRRDWAENWFNWRRSW